MTAPTHTKPLILVIHGPNLNMLGTRETDVYGTTTMAEINADLENLGNALNLSLEFFQSNHEGAIVDEIQQASGRAAGVIINPAAYTHTSIAIRDALALIPGPIIEVHISNIYRRESFRHKSLISNIADGQICGLGVQGYSLALRAMSEMLVR